MTRARLPFRRETDTIEIAHVTPDGVAQAFDISVGRYEDGKIAEVFVDVPYAQAKFASALLGKDVGTLISIALQHGAQLDELRAAMGRSDVNVMGRVEERPHTICGTILDALTREAGRD